MHTSGIAVTQELARAFHAEIEDANTLFVKFSIDLKNDVFLMQDVGKATGDRAGDFAAAAALLEPKLPCYILIRGENAERWVTIFYVPDNSPVRNKMVFASSSSGLKTGLGVKFETEFAIGTAEECTYENYKKVFASTNEDNIMTWQEREAKETLYETHTGFDEVKVSAIMGIPIPAAENVEPNLKALIGKEKNCCELILNPDTEILGSELYDITLAELVASKLPEKEPRYFMLNYKMDFEGKEEEHNLFIYYCPAACVPKQKMFYSSSKATILKLLTQLGVDKVVNLEADCPAEISDTIVQNEIHPPKAEDTSFAKPKAGGRKGGRPKMPKFQA